MNKLICVLLCATAVSAALAADPVAPIMPRNEAEARAKAEKMRRRTGGFVIDRREAKGTFVFANAQKLVPAKDLEPQVSSLESECMIQVKLAACDPLKPADAPGKMKELGALAAVFLTECDCPLSILTAPEQKFAIVNVKALSKDKPDAQTLAFRTRKEMSRALAMVFGAGYTNQGGGVLAPAFSLDDVDSLSMGALPMEASNMVTEMAKRIGFVPFRRSLYVRALREGWAPAPKGEFQKALWEQYHAKPTEPMRVEFDKKKGE